MMIRDSPMTELRYDAPSDTAELVGEEPAFGESSRRVRANLLLDAAGHLVGVDFGDAFPPDRLVAMLGPHEAVARQVEALVDVWARGDAIMRVRIANGRSAVRAGEKSPYAG
jgi:hypothetical protein